MQTVSFVKIKKIEKKIFFRLFAQKHFIPTCLQYYFLFYLRAYRLNQSSNNWKSLFPDLDLSGPNISIFNAHLYIEFGLFLSILINISRLNLIMVKINTDDIFTLTFIHANFNSSVRGQLRFPFLYQSQLCPLFINID